MPESDPLTRNFFSSMTMTIREQWHIHPEHLSPCYRQVQKLYSAVNKSNHGPKKSDFDRKWSFYILKWACIESFYVFKDPNANLSTVLSPDKVTIRILSVELILEFLNQEVVKT